MLVRRGTKLPLAVTGFYFGWGGVYELCRELREGIGLLGGTEAKQW